MLGLLAWEFKDLVVAGDMSEVGVSEVPMGLIGLTH